MNPPDMPPPRLFIVDDEAALTQALCSTLAIEGFETQGFADADSALQALETQRCDLLLVDLHLPRMLGPDLLRAAREFDPCVVGIVMTGEASIANAVEAMKAGALDFIVKPFRLDAILPAIARGLQVRELLLSNAALQRSLQEHAAALETANRDLALANGELAAFNHSVSHDLRAPLRSLGGLAKLLLERHGPGLPEETQRLMRAMGISVDRMQHLVDDLLRLSSFGHGAIEPLPVDMAQLARSVVDELRADQPARPLELRIGELPPARGDASLLRQVLVNLLSNAFKFTRLCERACIEVDAHAGEHGVTVYRVRDNGAGFDLAQAGQLFGPFRRLHRADQFEGNGVGLSIVKRIVERHGGRIWAEAAPGKGATFSFTLAA